jgi:hypothetical protein
MEDIIIGIKTVFLYMFYFAIGFIFLTFFISTLISLLFGDYNIIKNFLYVFKPQKEIDSENLERHSALMKIIQPIFFQNPKLYQETAK